MNRCTKLFISTLIFFLWTSVGFAQDERKIDIKELPGKAQDFIKKNFNKETTKQVLHEVEDFIDKGYEVIYKSKIKVKFDKLGNWLEVDGNRKPIPKDFIPDKIINYVHRSFPNNEIVKIEVSRKKYSVEISNGLELEFDKEGNFLRIDS